jgi:hypothetical protein
VFSSLPRYQGWGVTEGDRHAGVDRELGGLSHFLALIPGQGPPELLGQPGNRGGECGADLLSFVPLGQRDQGEVAAGPLHQRHHRRWPPAHQQVAFPVARHRPILGLRRPLADQHHLAELTAALGQALAPRGAHRPPRPQTALQLTAQRTTALHQQREVGGLVRHPQHRILR